MTPGSAMQAAAGHLRAGRLDEAERLYRQVVESAPANAPALYGLAIIAGRKGDAAGAADLLQRAIESDPDNARYHCMRGAICLQLERTEEGLRHFRRALEIDPDHLETLQRYAKALGSLGRREAALQLCERLVQLRPDAAFAHFKLASALTALKRYREAVAAFRKGLELDPDHAIACRDLGRVLQVQGDFEEAARLFRKALELAPANAVVHYDLARCKRYAPGDPHIAEMEALLRNGKLDRRSRASLHFALTKVYDDAGLYDDAFRHGRAANELLNPGFDAAAHEHRVTRLMDCFSEDLFARAGDMGSDDARHVFIVGMPRSGTTLVDQIVSSHPAVHSAGELIFFHQTAASLPRHLGSARPYPDCVRDAHKNKVRELADIYEKVFKGLSPDVARITNKFPENFRVLGVIALLFPRARVIHCRRDPMDVCLSCYFQDLPVNFHAYSFDLEALGRYYRQYERLMAHWKKVLPTPIVDVSYEDLVANQEAESRRLIDFLGLDWDDRCLEFQKNETPVGTASLWQVRQPIYTSSLGRWKRYEKHLDPLKKALGDG